MFRGPQNRLRFALENGTTIIGMGRISIYEPRGTYQIILEYLEPAGLGGFQIVFEQLKKRLHGEGLFDEKYKKKIPFLPLHIGIISSQSGVAIQDIISIAFKRFQNLNIEIYPVRVQGEYADKEISDAISFANRRAAVDVIILARGGGSLEDLSAFNSETTARAIFNSLIPIVSAIGHETDFTISDFVADLRAPTPSAAAQMIIPLKSDLYQRCTQLKKQCIDLILKKLNISRHHIQYLKDRIEPCKMGIENKLQRLDELSQRLRFGALACFHYSRGRYLAPQKLLRSLSPMAISSKNKLKLEILTYRLKKTIDKFLSNKHHDLHNRVVRLNSANPKSILKRGYSITYSRPQNQIILDAGFVKEKQDIEVILAEGAIQAIVTGKTLSEPYKDKSYGTANV